MANDKILLTRNLDIDGPRRDRDLAQIAALMSAVEAEPTTPEGLATWLERKGLERYRLAIMDSTDGSFAGYACAFLPDVDKKAPRCFLAVEPSSRRLGVGTMLERRLREAIASLGSSTAVMEARDDDEASLRFAEKRGWIRRGADVEMVLNLSGFDPAPYNAGIARLEGLGFRFTTMAELGDGVESRRRLYFLNNESAKTQPGRDGSDTWPSYEAFERDVCGQDWYDARGQCVAIHQESGEWVSMSAITRFQGEVGAYNLYSGTLSAWRSRGLATAVKAKALGYAKSLAAPYVRTSHSAENAAMIGIDERFGYLKKSGRVTFRLSLD